ncbi:MAG: RluA family pseudouridine synthase [Desulfobacteraceae bacterium]|nr:RluA family pseudouridine synthase [Desulfobacteraceae bacterium]
MERIIAITLTCEHAGAPLLELLACRFNYLGREEWRQELAAGRLLVNGSAGQPHDRLVEGDVLVYRPATLDEPPVDWRYAVVYEDEDLLVVDKPAPLPCHPGGRYFRHTLWARLKENRGIESPAFVNRLDRETSGLVLVAKNRTSARRCQAQFAAGEVRKTYLVVVEGAFPRGESRAEGWLAPDVASAVRKKLRFLRGGIGLPGQPIACGTSFRLLGWGNAMSLLAAWPHTGRCHQIRATLCSLGFPVVGDKLYGVDERFFLRLLDESLTAADRDRLRIGRQALHAAALRFRHPGSGRMLTFTAPPPPGLERLVPGTAAAWSRLQETDHNLSGGVEPGTEPSSGSISHTPP